jgi:Ca2+-binding EF-hand superfamily protein
MSPGYSLWYMHGETAQGYAVLGRCSSHPSVTDSAAGSTEHGECTEQGGRLEQGGDIRTMLHDAFGVNELGEVVSIQPQEVNEGTSGGDALKYHEFLKTAEKTLHPSTKHSKLSATVHMYNLKCVGSISNKIFSDILELINQLLPPSDETLPVNTYEAKKFLNSMGLGYEKIPACRNDCTLFWKDNKDFDSCTICGEYKWRVTFRSGW